jgi:hypothetical protein
LRLHQDANHVSIVANNEVLPEAAPLIDSWADRQRIVLKEVSEDEEMGLEVGAGIDLDNLNEDNPHEEMKEIMDEKIVTQIRLH